MVNKKFDDDRAFNFFPVNDRGAKPRTSGVTEIRGPNSLWPVGPNYMEDIFKLYGYYVDSFKFVGGTYRLIPSDVVKEMIDLCHKYDVMVSTGGFTERVLKGPDEHLDLYLKECVDLGFDIVEISENKISIDYEDIIRVIKKVKEYGLKPKPEVGVMRSSGYGGDADWAVAKAAKYLEAGAYLIMMESEGITENSYIGTKGGSAEGSIDKELWNTGIVTKFINALGLRNIMFEAAEKAVFTHYIENYGPGVNLFIDNSQIGALEGVRSNVFFGPVTENTTTYKG